MSECVKGGKPTLFDDPLAEGPCEPRTSTSSLSWPIRLRYCTDTRSASVISSCVSAGIEGRLSDFESGLLIAATQGFLALSPLPCLKAFAKQIPSSPFPSPLP